MLTKESFLELFKRDEKPKEVTVGGKSFFVRRISWEDKKAISKETNEGKKDVSNAFLIRAIGNENGERLFADTDDKMIDAMDPADVEAIFDAAWDFNAMGKKEHDELKKSS